MEMTPQVIENSFQFQNPRFLNKNSNDIGWTFSA